MPPITDPQDFGDRVVQLGLATRADISASWKELGDPAAAVDDLIRILQRRGVLTSFQADQVKKGISDGFFYGGYKILYMLAAGSFARVYRAEKPEGGRQVVAVKVLRNRWANDKQSVKAFYDEGNRVMPLRHPNIVKTYDVGSEGNRPYIVMEFVEGGNLKDFMSIRRKLPPARAMPLMLDMVSGLNYAFGQNVTHRDIKLTNILVSVQGQAKLVDFGMGNVKEEGDTKQTAQRGVRTVDYSALERMTGAPKGDPRSDIYFLGCVFYTMITGRHALPEASGNDPLAKMLKRSFAAIKPVQEIAPDVPASLAAVVDRMMEMDPKKRYQHTEPIFKEIQGLWEAEQAREKLAENRAAEAEADAAEISEPAAAEDSAAVADGRPALLFLEGQREILETLRERFERLGYAAVVTAEPAEAKEKFSQRLPHCLIVDAESSGKEGMLAFLAMVKAGQKIGRNVPSILILGQKQSIWSEHVKPDEQHVVIYKPLKLKEIEEQVQKILPVPSL